MTILERALRTKAPIAVRLLISLPVLIVASSCCIALATGGMAAWSFYNQSRLGMEATLTLQAQSRRAAVEDVMRAMRSDLVAAASNPLLQRALDAISTSLKIMPAEQREAIKTSYGAGEVLPENGWRNPLDFYGRAFDQLQPWFAGLAHESGYGDILFIDAAGDVPYSLMRRSDFGGNVHAGAIAGSVVERLFDRARNMPPRTTVISEIESYGPAGGPVAFAATPVFDSTSARKDLLGVLLVEVPTARLEAILGERTGFGHTGEALIAGSDRLMRVPSRFRSAIDVLRLSVDDGRLVSPRADHVLEYVDADGHSRIAASAPLSSDSGLPWTVVAQQSTDEVMVPLKRMVTRIAAIGTLVTLLMGWIAAGLATRLARPVVALVERFQAALANMPHGLVMVDGENRLILCNKAFGDLYRLPGLLTDKGTTLGALDRFRQMQGMAPAGDFWPAEGRLALADGRSIDVVTNPLPSGGFVATHQNVTATVEAQRQVAFLATHDPLTGLLNRASLSERMGEALERVRGGEKLAVLCLDLDHFKSVNDTLGHPAGDALLRGVTERLSACLGPRDAMARLGGDEFVVLQGGIHTTDEALQLAARLIAAAAEPFEIDNHRVLVGLSVGIATAPGDGLEADALIRSADTALYRAKAGGRGSARCFEPAMDAQLQARRQLELDLRQALTEGRFTLAYQPIYEVRNEQIGVVEALLRWQHPVRGAVSPAEFIPLAEEMGLIVSIGEWVLRQACRDAATWPGTVRVAVNLSALQLKSRNLMPVIVQALASSGLTPERLELEITESVLLGDDEATLATLRALKRLGIRIAMDDFGTGYSSLSYLRSFPFDRLKIDRSFVRGLGSDPDGLAIIKAIVELGTTLGMSTTVEGVETAEQLALVRSQGCTAAQGYYLCRPVASGEVTRVLRAANPAPADRLTA